CRTAIRWCRARFGGASWSSTATAGKSGRTRLPGASGEYASNDARKPRNCEREGSVQGTSAMSRCRIHLLLAAVVVLFSVRAALADGPAQVAADEARLKKAEIKHDGESLLQLLRQRSLTDAEREQVLLNIR